MDNTSPQSTTNLQRGTPVARGSTAADTVININTQSSNQQSPAVVAPVIAPAPVSVPAAPVYQPQPVAAQPRMGMASQQAYAESQQSYHTPAPTTVTRTVTRKEINWGGVIKGVAIVTAVAVAGVAAFSLTAGAAGWVMATPVAQGVASMLAPVVGAVMSGLSWVAGFIPSIPGIVGGFFTNLMTGLGFTGITAAQTAAVTSGAGLLGAGATVAAGTAVAAPLLENMGIIKHTQAQVTTVADHAATLPDAGHSSTLSLFSKKSSAVQQASDPTMLLDDGAALSNALNAPNNATHAAHVAHATHASHASHAAHTAAELGHHSLHGSEHHHENPTRNWRDRMTTSSGYQQAYQSNGGSHSAAIRATQPQQQGTIIPRASEFAQAVTDDRTRLDAALAETSR